MLEMRLETWTTKNAKKVTAVTTKRKGKRVVITFDYAVISKLTGFDFEEIKNLDEGVIKLES